MDIKASMLLSAYPTDAVGALHNCPTTQAQLSHYPHL